MERSRRAGTNQPESAGRYREPPRAIIRAGPDLVGLAATIGREFTPDVLASRERSWRGCAGSRPGRTLASPYRPRAGRRRLRLQPRQDSRGRLPRSQPRRGGAITTSVSRARWSDSTARIQDRSAVRSPHIGSAPVSSRQAIDWYRRAAEAAQRLHASAEAARLLDRALDLLGLLPETSQRGTREIAILAALPAVLGMAEGFASPRLADVHRRALELASTLGIELPPPLLRSLAIASLSQSDFARAQWFGQQLHARGEHNADDVLLVESDYVLGIAAFWQGELVVARRRFADRRGAIPSRLPTRTPVPLWVGSESDLPQPSRQHPLVPGIPGGGSAGA